MAKRKTAPATKDRMLTEAELELMTVLWKLGEGSVNDVLGELPAGRDLAYTTVSTILRILEQKGVLESRKQGRGHVYVPLVSKEAYETATVRHIVTKVFDGTPSSLVRRLLDSSSLSEHELEEIRSLLNERQQR